jgi:hypothetical protein
VFDDFFNSFSLGNRFIGHIITVLVKGEYLILRVRPVRFGNKPDRSDEKIINQDKKDE